MIENKKPFWKSGVFIIIVLAVIIVGVNLVNNSMKEPEKQVPNEERILFKFEKAGIWKVDRESKRCLVNPAVWAQLPLDKKEDTLRIIYREEGTWWELYDMYSGKLLGSVSSWGPKINP